MGAVWRAVAIHSPRCALRGARLLLDAMLWLVGAGIVLVIIALSEARQFGDGL